MSTNKHAVELRLKVSCVARSDPHGAKTMRLAADEIDRLEKELEQSHHLRATADQLEAARIEARDFQALVTLAGHALQAVLSRPEPVEYPYRTSVSHAAAALAAIKEHTDGK